MSKITVATSENLLADKQMRKMLLRIKRALCGYITYADSCRMRSAFSEYVLYEPILRVFVAHGYKVHCEHAHPAIPKKSGKGDFKKLDFYAETSSHSIAMEVKWVSSSKPCKVLNDFQKLSTVAAADTNCISLLCVFGRKKYIGKSRLRLNSNDFKELGRPVYVDRRPMYGCRIFRLKTDYS